MCIVCLCFATNLRASEPLASSKTQEIKYILRLKDIYVLSNWTIVYLLAEFQDVLLYFLFHFLETVPFFKFLRTPVNIEVKYAFSVTDMASVI